MSFFSKKQNPDISWRENDRLSTLTNFAFVSMRETVNFLIERDPKKFEKLYSRVENFEGQAEYFDIDSVNNKFELTLEELGGQFGLNLDILEFGQFGCYKDPFFSKEYHYDQIAEKFFLVAKFLIYLSLRRHLIISNESGKKKRRKVFSEDRRQFLNMRLRLFHEHQFIERMIAAIMAFNTASYYSESDFEELDSRNFKVFSKLPNIAFRDMGYNHYVFVILKETDEYGMMGIWPLDMKPTNGLAFASECDFFKSNKGFKIQEKIKGYGEHLSFNPYAIYE